MYTTIYKKRVKKRTGPYKGKTVIEEAVYQTKTLTSLHAAINAIYPGSETWEGGQLWYMVGTSFPFVLGGKKVDFDDND